MVQSIRLIIAQATNWIRAKVGVVECKVPERVHRSQTEQLLKAANSIVTQVQVSQGRQVLNMSDPADLVSSKPEGLEGLEVRKWPNARQFIVVHPQLAQPIQ